VHASRFNVAVRLPGRDELFLLNTLTDAHAVVSPDVLALVERLEREPGAEARLGPEEREALAVLAREGFVVESREAEQAAVERFFADFREDTSQLRLTVLTTLQCNFACDYCVQGDHGEHNRQANRMSLETAAAVAAWAEARLDAMAPASCVLTFFGGEPLLNLPVVYFLAERMWQACTARGVTLLVNVITNGLLLTPEVVERLRPFGLNGVKVTLDGVREAHDRARPLRGGQGTFDRIVENIRRVAGRCKVAIGGNFDVETAADFPGLLEFLAAQEFAPLLDKVTFKPVIRPRPAPSPPGVIPLLPAGGDGSGAGGVCRTAAGAGLPRSSPCDTCHFVDEQMSALREATIRHGFRTVDGVHMGPCELHRRHAYTVGPDGSLYACPGFSGEAGQAVGHIDGRTDAALEAAAKRFDAIAAWRQCGDCAFVPVCGGGCAAAAHTELGDMHAPACHKPAFESALAGYARDHAGAAAFEEVPS
jgi:uncharacterized protein